MREICLVVAFVIFCSLTFGSSVQAGESDRSALDSCLEHWGKHPFGKGPQYRVISGKVKVFGIGDDINDDKKTDKPELVLIKPNVNVMGKAEMDLLNPNGWYCLKAKVAVLGKTTINLHCKANLASSGDGATVFAASDADHGVTVLGTSRLNRVECKE